MSNHDQPPPPAWTIDDVARYLQTTRSKIYTALGDPAFPRPVWLSKRTPRWSPDAVPAWVEAGGAIEAPERPNRRRTSQRRLIERV